MCVCVCVLISSNFKQIFNVDITKKIANTVTAETCNTKT